ncbi:MAG: response regulator transcription factor [Colwellia sp.]
MINNILLIDYDVELTLVLKNYLANEGFNVCICNTAQEGINEASRNQYNIIIMDIVTPVFDGFELLKSLKSIDLCPVMIMTMRDEHFDRIYALELGAEDYLLKPVNRRELLARMKVIMRRVSDFNNQLPKNIININNMRLNRARREVFCEQQVLNLTGSEFEVLYFLMSNAGKINSKENIGKFVFGRSVSYYDRSIDMHISNIRKKIALHGKKTTIKTIRGIGYTFLSDQNYSDIKSCVNGS